MSLSGSKIVKKLLENYSYIVWKPSLKSSSFSKTLVLSRFLKSLTLSALVWARVNSFKFTAIFLWRFDYRSSFTLLPIILFIFSSNSAFLIVGLSLSVIVEWIVYLASSERRHYFSKNSFYFFKIFSEAFCIHSNSHTDL